MGGSRGFGYDGAGNVVTDNRGGTVYGYTYNSAGRMAALSVGGVPTATYTYDAMGRQAIRTLVPSGLTIHSVFDSEGRRIAEYNQATGALIREYVWMGWDPVAVIEGGVVYLVRADHIGRPAFATTLSGTKVWSAPPAHSALPHAPCTRERRFPSAASRGMGRAPTHHPCHPPIRGGWLTWVGPPLRRDGTKTKARRKQDA